MKELIIISGKGGTGKTTITSSFAALASREGKAVFADCDVDAADLHLIFNPSVRETHSFVSGKEASVIPEKCVSRGSALPAHADEARDEGPQTDGTHTACETDTGAVRSNRAAAPCSVCADVCRFESFSFSPGKGYFVKTGGCEGCGLCERMCPHGAIQFLPRRCGDWFISDTRFGTLVHAALDPHAENSGKLVTTVRKEAKRSAQEQNADLIIADGSPGTGCPVIASITGADAVLIVTEPTKSGQHDLERAASLARRFNIPAAVCVNKADINEEQTELTRRWCERNNIMFAGTVRYSAHATRAQIQGLSVIEYEEQLLPVPAQPTAQLTVQLTAQPHISDSIREIKNNVYSLLFPAAI